MTIALVDDDRSQLDYMHALLFAALKIAGIEVRRMDTYDSGEAFLAAFSPHAYDIIILDIYMNEENGVDIARRIREQDTDVVLAFCTSSNEFAAESYEVGAGYYLQKPISGDRLTAMLRRLDLSRIERTRTVCLPDGFRCLLRSIIYTEYSNHSVTFHLRDADPHSVYMNHAEAEELLLRYRQFRVINKGSIVNFAGVRRLTGNAFLMINGETVPIARRRFKEISEAYTQYHFDRMKEEVDT